MVITANPPKFDKRQPSKGGYDAIVYIDGSEVVAEDSNGRKIASGVAGTDDSTVINAIITVLGSRSHIHFSSDVFNINSPVIIGPDNHGFMFSGNGCGLHTLEGNTTFNLSDDISAIIDVAGNAGAGHVKVFGVRDISFANGLGGAHHTGSAIKATNINDLSVRDCDMSWFVGGAALDIDTVWSLRLLNSQIRYSGIYASQIPAVYLKSTDGVNTDVVVSYCTFEGNKYAAIGGTSLTSTSIDKNYFEQIDTSSDYAFLAAIALVGDGVKIFDNHFSLSSIVNTNRYCMALAGNRFDIHDNYIYKYWIGIDSWSPSALNSANIHDNYFNGQSAFAIRHLNSYPIYIVSNHFQQCGDGSSHGALNISSSKVVTDNEFNDCNQNAILLLDASDTVCSRNKFAKTSYLTYGIRETGSCSLGKYRDNVFVGGVQYPITLVSIANIFGNVGFIAPGESRSVSGLLTAGNADAIAFYWHNTELQDILIKKVTIRITTPGGTAGSLLDVGIADDAAGTNLGTEFFNDIDLNTAAIVKSTIATPGTQTVEVFCQDSVSATDGWIIGKILVENAASLIGSYYIEYEGA